MTRQTLVDAPLLERMLTYIDQQHPRARRGVAEARAMHPKRFDCIAEMHLRWLVVCRGEQAVAPAVDAFIDFTTKVNLAQAAYESEGKYAHQSFAEVYQQHYSNDETMDEYLWGIYLTNFLWAHHFEIMMFYEDRFLSRLEDNVQFVEIAPGHGGWGVAALNRLPKAQLTGYDISAQSISIATRLAQAAEVNTRAQYQKRDAMDLDALAEQSADACICCFLAEHLEQPDKLYRAIAHLLKPRRSCFLTVALTAAQIDHIYEYRYESQVIAACEQAGLRVVETLSGAPKRTFPAARFLPRSLTLIVQRRAGEFF